jgi:acetyltransferase-like isoleucine patch superfamily enzyme
VPESFDDPRLEIRESILMYEASRSMTDVERAKYFGLPEGCRMREGAKIISPEKLKIGEHCWIGEGAILDASGGLEIGSHTSIGLSAFIWTHDSFLMNVRGKNTPEHKHLIKRSPTKIGSNCFIAGPSTVLRGVTIGDGCVIAPMSVVRQDLPAGTVYSSYDHLAGEISKIKRHLDID